MLKNQSHPLILISFFWSKVDLNVHMKATFKTFKLCCSLEMELIKLKHCLLLL
jgi:hypothetical protein